MSWIDSDDIFVLRNNFFLCFQSNRIVVEFTDLYEPVYTSLFTWSLETICGACYVNVTHGIRLVYILFLKFKFFYARNRSNYDMYPIVCCSFDLQSQPKINVMLVVVIISFAFYAFGLLFIVCELIQRATNNFKDIGDIISQIEWHLISK